MSPVAQVAAAPVERVRARWIVSQRYDLLLFIGSCVVSWTFLAFYLALERWGGRIGADAVLVTYCAYTVFFDQPHIFQTFSRTHADETEFRRHRVLHTWGLAAFVGAGFVLAAAGADRIPIVVAGLYESWHILRQHWGFLRLYKSANDDFDPVDDRLDAAVFYLGMVGFVLHHYSGSHNLTPVYGDLQVRFPLVPDPVAEVTLYAFGVALVLFLGRQVQRLATGRPVVLPKLLLMTTALVTHAMVFLFSAAPFLVAEAIETAWHDVQYHGFIAHFQRRRLGGSAPRKWLGMALLYGLIVGGVEVVGLTNRGWSWIFAPFAMLVVWHYYVDGKIWKLRTQPELGVLVHRDGRPSTPPRVSVTVPP